LRLALLLVPFAFFPLAVDPSHAAGTDGDPVSTVLLWAFSVGVPFLVVSTSAPLLQKRFASTDHPAARDPYLLYGASSLGSMIALFGYPTVVEPWLTLAEQCRLWGIGYGLLALLTAVRTADLWRSARGGERPGREPQLPAAAKATSPAADRVRGAVWAACGVGALFGLRLASV
jgi:hypothetical protein